MAMSRSFGGRSLTTLPSMRISPEVTLSRPATMLSKVDLPEPEPPTRIRNWPSLISMSMPLRTSTPFVYTLRMLRIDKLDIFFP